MIYKTLLWRVGSDTEIKSYLFGTLHLSNAIAYKHIQKAFLYLQRCEHFYAEINLDEAQEDFSPANYLLPDNQTLSDFISDRKLAKLTRVFSKGFGVELRNYENLLPIIFINKLTEALLENNGGKSLDAALWEEAKRLRMNMSGLESLEEQTTLLRSLDIPTQIKSLKDIVRDINKFRKSTKKLAAFYEDQNIHSLHKMSKKQLGSMRKALLYDRNKIMALRIWEHRDEKSFFAIGAGHLAGKKGVLALLKNKGLTIKPVKD